MEEYEFFELRVIPIMVGKILYDAGREKRYLKGLGSEGAEPDDYYTYIWEGLTEICDFQCGREVGPYMDSCWYFSDQSMMDFYRLCRDWSKQRGIRLKDNPYMKQASREAAERMRLDSWCYTYHLHTGVHHKWASGIAIYSSCEFNQDFRLLVALAELFAYYKQMTKELRYDIWKYEQEQQRKVLYLPLPKERKEAA